MNYELRAMSYAARGYILWVGGGVLLGIIPTGHGELTNTSKIKKGVLPEIVWNYPAGAGLQPVPRCYRSNFLGDTGCKPAPAGASIISGLKAL